MPTKFAKSRKDYGLVKMCENRSGNTQDLGYPFASYMSSISVPPAFNFRAASSLERDTNNLCSDQCICIRLDATTTSATSTQRTTESDFVVKTKNKNLELCYATVKRCEYMKCLFSYKVTTSHHQNRYHSIPLNNNYITPSHQVQTAKTAKRNNQRTPSQSSHEPSPLFEISMLFLS